jgi:hypothetical protein
MLQSGTLRWQYKAHTLETIKGRTLAINRNIVAEEKSMLSKYTTIRRLRGFLVKTTQQTAAACIRDLL